MRMTLDSTRYVTDEAPHVCRTCEATIPAGDRHLIGTYQTRFLWGKGKRPDKLTVRLCMPCVRIQEQIPSEEAPQS